MTANRKTAPTAAETALSAQLAARAGDGPDWLQAARDKAAAALAERGLPNRRVEEWKYTDLRRLMGEALPPADRAAAAALDVDLSTLPFATLEGPRAVFVNGVLRDDLSDLGALAEGVAFVSFAKAAAEGPAWMTENLGTALGEFDTTIADLNAGLAEDGFVIHVKGGARQSEPLRVIFLNAGDAPHAAYARNLVVVEEGAELHLIEAHAHAGSGAAYQSNTVVELVAGTASQVRHVRFQREAADALHLGLTGVELQAGASYRAVAMTLGAGIARHQVHLTFAGEGAHGAYAEAALLRGTQHCDTTIFADHRVPGCDSREVYKGVLDERARGVFQGKILVRPSAQQTDARQASDALLLSDDAEMDAKPELEIFADDVQCAHGATSGRINEDLLFYLMARGIPRRRAAAMLMEAFVAEALDQVEHQQVRAAMAEKTQNWLQEWSGP